MCYVNAGILALLHVCVRANLDVPEMQPIIKVATLASQRQQALSLTRMHHFRSLTPSWRFGPAQQDTAEYLYQLFQTVPALGANWDLRVTEDGEPKVSLQGISPIHLTLPLQPKHTLQELIEFWHKSADDPGGITALTYAFPIVCLQIERYTAEGKRKLAVSIPEMVRLPVFDEASNIVWKEYSVHGALLHLGRFTTSGHYRALLKVGASWFLTDDHKQAAHVQLHDGHLKNVYVVFCGPVPVAASQLPSTSSY